MIGNRLDEPVRAGPLSRWDPRFKIVALLTLAFAISSLSSPHLLPLAVAVTATCVMLSGFSPRVLVRRLRYPSIVILALVALLPFLSGTTPLVRIGPLALMEEGLDAALLVAVRFYCIVTLAIALLGSTPLLVNIRALRALGLPDIMADMALLVVRHIEVHSEDMRRMRTAMRLRGHDARTFSWRNLRALAWLTGSLLLRSHERSERVYMAMRLRGYGSERTSPEEFRAGPRDLSLLGAALLAAGVLFWLEFAP